MKKFLSLFLAAVLLFCLAACGGGDTGESTAEDNPQTEQNGGDATASAEPAHNLTDQAFLTGLQKGSDYPEGKRITGIMVNNIAQARPLSGLSAADVLVEIKVEGGITRFMALYDDYETIPRVGPIRSARDQFFQLLLPYWGFYVHIGESVVQTQYKIDWEYEDFDINGDYDGSMILWDQERQAQGYAQEHTAYTDGEHISEHIQNYDMDTARTYNSPIFNFVPYNEPPRVPEEGTIDSVAVVHSASYRSLFDYDPAKGVYEMSQYNTNNDTVEPTIDADNNEQLAFENLLVLFTEINPYPGHEAKDLQKVGFDTGPGYYFTQGGYEFVIWKKGGPQNSLQIFTQDKTETPITINTGRTYLSMVDLDEWDHFYESITQGNADDVVAAGEANPDEQEIDD